jgi:hypothetical protein
VPHTFDDLVTLEQAAVDAHARISTADDPAAARAAAVDAAAAFQAAVIPSASASSGSVIRRPGLRITMCSPSRGW